MAERDGQDNDYSAGTEMEKLQDIILTLAGELKRVCEKYELRYFMHAGSLLGMIRHKGFIPWDDDMDFVLPRKDFELLMEISEKEIKAPFFLQTYKNTPSMVTLGRIRLRMDGTTGVQLAREFRESYHQGLAIDIAPLDCLNENTRRNEYIWKKQDQYACIHYMKHFGARRKWPGKCRWYESWLYRLEAKIFSDSFIADKLTDIACMDGRLWEIQDGKLCVVSSECMGHYRHLILKQEWYKEQVMLPFNGTLFPAPVGFRDILKLYYGNDYMECPPPEERKGHHFPIMSTEQSYIDFLRPFRDIFKDIDGKEIVVFGAGEMLRYYLEHTKRLYHPVFIVDNDPKKWGGRLFDIPVKAPDKILELPSEKQYVIICSIYYKEIMKQLENMGVKNYYVFVQNPNWL